jgi:hypothetical protein
MSDPEEQACNIEPATRRLLSIEGGRADEAEAGLNALQGLRSLLTKLVGPIGYQALLSRALALATAQMSWLGTVRVLPDASLEGFRDAAQRQPAGAASEGSAALLGELLGLLVAFIGETLTLHLVEDVWPEAKIVGGNRGAEEAGG